MSLKTSTYKNPALMLSNDNQHEGSDFHLPGLFQCYNFLILSKTLWIINALQGM